MSDHDITPAVWPTEAVVTEKPDLATFLMALGPHQRVLFAGDPEMLEVRTFAWHLEQSIKLNRAAVEPGDLVDIVRKSLAMLHKRMTGSTGDGSSTG